MNDNLGMLRSLVLALLTVCLASAVLAAAPTVVQQRVALVVGNSAYPASPLKNPGNDARAMAARLKELDFDVILVENLRTRQIAPVLRDFRSRLRPGAVALFFYAGHGIQIKGMNYLPTVDAEIASEEDVPFNSINVGQLLDLMEDTKTQLNIMFIDACRNNPFSRRFRSATSGLARMDMPSGSLISFATRPGSVADDGDADHGLYTQSLLAQIGTPGLAVEQTVERVVAGVKKSSSGQQVPWMEATLDGDFYFAAAPVPMADQSAAFELSFWDSIKGSNDPDDFRAYLKQYPQGRFAALAESRLHHLAGAKVSGGAPASVVTAVEADTKVFRDCPECPDMVVVPAGSFTMGAPAHELGSGDAERPRREVRITRPLAVARHEITRGQFAAFVEATGYKSEGSCRIWVGGEWQAKPGRTWRDPGFGQDDSHPAVCVSWHDARAYAAWLAMKTGKPYRLPTEAEWEYAARAGTRTSRYWGDDPDLACDYANVHDAATQKAHAFSWEPHGCNDGYAETAPVGRFKPNAYGLHDLLGNVWEWVEDCESADYVGAPTDGSARAAEDCDRRMFRGGGWSGPASVRAAGRSGNPPSYRSQLLGFRVARPAP